MAPVLVLFETGCAPYISGDVAGFPPEDAQRFVEHKKARLLQPAEIAALRRPRPVSKSTEPDTVLVQFHQSHPPYRNGEVAGFSPEKAAELIKAGKADEIDPEDVPASPASERPAPLRRHKDGGASIAPPDLTKTVLCFVRSAHGYMGGELAGFDEDVAAELVKSGVALDPKAEAAKEAAARRALLEAADDDRRKEQVEKERLEVERKAEAERLKLAAQQTGGEPPASSVSPDVEVTGLDDRKPDWREEQAKQGTDQPPAAGDKALDGPPMDKMERGSVKKGRG